jgi:hypothetical protein
MRGLNSLIKVFPLRVAALLAAVVMLPGCGIFSAKSKITVPQLLTPLVEADTPRLLEEVNRFAGVRSMSGKIDITFLDTSFAQCGIADLYRTAEGRLIVQRPGQIYLDISFLTYKIAEMSSDGERFWAALKQGEAKNRKFVTGRNNAAYGKLAANGDAATNPDCRRGGKVGQAARERATVSALSSLRPQHFGDALLVPPSLTDPAVYYARGEDFQEEPDTRVGAKKNARVVRSYYVLSEFKTAEPGRATLLRRFWFDRVGAIRLARVQTYDERGQLITDVVYGAQKPFNQGQLLPAQLELTRPQEHYSIRIAFQDPTEVRVNQPFGPETFVLKNESNLPEVDLDAMKKEAKP